MKLRTSQFEQFSEELYFLLMTSSLRDRIRALGERHGLGLKAMRQEILSEGAHLTRRIELSLSDVRSRPRIGVG